MGQKLDAQQFPIVRPDAENDAAFSMCPANSLPKSSSGDDSLAPIIPHPRQIMHLIRAVTGFKNWRAALSAHMQCSQNYMFQLFSRIVSHMLI
ncbi:MAG: hypothetical protein WBL87_05440, partial [Methanothrix sp.]